MIKYLLSLSRHQKQVVMMIFDLLLVSLALWMAFSLRYSEPYFPTGREIWLWAMAPAIALPIFVHFKLYQAIIKYIGFKALWSVFQAVTLYAIIWGVIAFLSGIQSHGHLLPRSVVVINWWSSLLLVLGVRMVARWMLTGLMPGLLGVESDNVRNALIYGAGTAGRQLVAAANIQRDIRILAFIDDDKDMQHRLINGLKVYPASEIPRLIEEYGIKEVLLAMPVVTRQRRNQILNLLAPYPVHVQTLPTLSELSSSHVSFADVREIAITDLLERDAVDSVDSLLHANITDKVVLVTGAGGSIGSELCRQISRLQPKNLILFDHSEYNLYQVERELRDKFANLVPIIGSVLDKEFFAHVCKRYGVQTIYHAAAYKHVPLVEKNPVAGVVNNVFGTKNCALGAIAAQVETFVLISTDKAVRPTNVMGASKRIAELILQDLSEQNDQTTRFSIVRFGNVLDSSGSVVPLFREQISHGGPVTVTHPDIIRYFMTITEATQLVLQAGAMGQGGEVFVLDMGEPIPIRKLAEKMIHLSGYSVRTEDNPNGDIEIEFSGLREGEKLYEELLISDTAVGTAHPRIMREVERGIHLETLPECLAQMSEFARANNPNKMRQLLFKMVEPCEDAKHSQLLQANVDNIESVNAASKLH